MYSREEYVLTDPFIKKDLLRLFNKDNEIVILDIGACEGEESIRYSKIFPNSKIYCFEPVPKNQELILQNIQSHNLNNIELVPCALSDEEGFQKLYVSSGKPNEMGNTNDWDFGNKSSSLLPPYMHIVKFPWVSFDKEIIVVIKKLSSFLIERNILIVDFVHLDVQGAELKVLKGAESFINSIKAIWLEVSNIELYKDQPLRSNIEDFMVSNGFFLEKTKMEGQIGDQLYLNKSFFKRFFGFNRK
jgi:FkbM family methyltransferase